MIAELASTPPAAAPGLLVLLLVAVAASCAGILVWDAAQRHHDFELREQSRRDQAAQREWNDLKAALARRQRQSTGPRVLP